MGQDHMGLHNLLKLSDRRNECVGILLFRGCIGDGEWDNGFMNAEKKLFSRRNYGLSKGLFQEQNNG